MTVLAAEAASRLASSRITDLRALVHIAGYFLLYCFELIIPIKLPNSKIPYETQRYAPRATGLEESRSALPQPSGSSILACRIRRASVFCIAFRHIEQPKVLGRRLAE